MKRVLLTTARIIQNIAIVTALLWGAAARAQDFGQLALLRTPLSGITAATSSAVIKGASKCVTHVIKVEFPTAVATVSSIQVRLEFSMDGVTFLPFSTDITSATLISGSVYAYARGIGVFPAIRVRSVLAVPGAPPPAMTVRYSGSVLPVTPFLVSPSVTGDHWEFSAQALP